MNTILIVGDLFPTEQNVSFFSKGDIDSLFGKEITQLFSGADFRVCNLEGALTDHPDKCRKTGPVKVAATSAIEAYKKLGINCCMLANNHATDGGHQGMIDTMRNLDDAGINYIGAGKNDKEIVRHSVKELGGMRIGFYDVSETMYNKPTKDKAGAWLYDEYIVCRELEQLKKECDYLIVIYHGGIEKFHYPSPETRKRFRRMADCGADMILTQHTHCVGCEEYYNGSYLLYGQGDFLLKNFAPGLTDTGLIIELDVTDGRIEVKKHLVKSVDNLFVRYDENQDFSAFEERSRLLQDEEYVRLQLLKFCDGELRLYLKAFKSPSKNMMRFASFFPKAYKKWLYRYNERDLMFTLHTLRSEQNRETAIIGIEHLLNM
jgi:poly-gamma-glutamate synthesis protein (capsule biosynthesis protein)